MAMQAGSEQARPPAEKRVDVRLEISPSGTVAARIDAHDDDATGVRANDVEEPRDLCCPLTFSLLRDPVVLASGHTYERQAVENFWRQRPLANPLGGAALPSGRMVVNFLARSQVDSFLDAHPGYVPLGWNDRNEVERTRSSNEALVRTAQRHDARVDADKEYARSKLAAASPTCWLIGSPPEATERARRLIAMRAIGAYDLCVDEPLHNERHVYARRGDAEGPAQMMMWYVTYPNPGWCVGLRDHLGRRGILFIGSAALVPEEAGGSGFGWCACLAGRSSAAPNIRCCGDEQGRRWMAQQGCRDRSHLVLQLMPPLALLGTVAVAASGRGRTAMGTLVLRAVRLVLVGGGA
uniref:U-box domain-containing protein n=1 Tax=Prymnesium polylepis TaxID=72548 RepID=A0A6V4V5X7_9EUKA|mmetsp:Transcript_66312/g.181869  ORF Transcript_66312/g.181869 Transcript_66312/m.181869 type:complete len:352 (+) Transcript_66312:47-1102(+)